MKRTSYAHTRLKQQKSDFAGECHYGQVEEIAKKSIEEKKRKKRIDIIVKKGIRKDGDMELPNGSMVTVRFISSDGIITLDNWDQIDPLRLTYVDG